MASASWADAVRWSPVVSAEPADPPLSPEAEAVRETLWYPAARAVPSWAWEELVRLRLHQQQARLAELVQIAQIPWQASRPMAPSAPDVECKPEVAAVRDLFWNEGFNQLPLEIWEKATSMRPHEQREFLHRSLVAHCGGKTIIPERVVEDDQEDFTDDEYAAAEVQLAIEERERREEEDPAPSDEYSCKCHARADRPVDVPSKVAAAFKIIQDWLNREGLYLPQPLVVAFLLRLQPVLGEQLSPEYMLRRDKTLEELWRRPHLTPTTQNVVYAHSLRLRTTIVDEFFRLVRIHPMFLLKFVWFEAPLNELEDSVRRWAGFLYALIVYIGQTKLTELMRLNAGYWRQFWGVLLSVAGYSCWKAGDIEEIRHAVDAFEAKGLVHGDVPELGMMALLGSETLANRSVLGKAPLFSIDERLDPQGGFELDQELSLAIVVPKLPQHDVRFFSQMYVQVDNLLPRIFGTDVCAEIVHGAQYAALLKPIPGTSTPSFPSSAAFSSLSIPSPAVASLPAAAVADLQRPLRMDVILSLSGPTNAAFASLKWFSRVDGKPLRELRSGEVVDVRWSNPTRLSKYIYVEVGGGVGDDESKRIRFDRLAAALGLARDILDSTGVLTDATLSAVADAISAYAAGRRNHKLDFRLNRLRILHGPNIGAVREKCAEMRDWVGLEWDGETCLRGVQQNIAGLAGPRFQTARVDGAGRSASLHSKVAGASGRRGVWDITATAVVIKDASTKVAIREIPLEDALNSAGMVAWIELNLWEKRLDLKDIPKPAMGLPFRAHMQRRTGYGLFGADLTADGTEFPWRMVKYMYRHSPDKAAYELKAAQMRAELDVLSERESASESGSDSDSGYPGGETS